MQYSDVSACLVTRGNIDMKPIIDSLPFDDIVVWDNSEPWGTEENNVAYHDLKAYGRYAAIPFAKNDIIYFQDDDCIIPIDTINWLMRSYEDGKVVMSMPSDHYPDDTEDKGLIGWGSLFYRDLPSKAFETFLKYFDGEPRWLDIGADIVFANLTPKIRILGEHINFPYAYGADRTYNENDYVEHRTAYWIQVREVRRLETGG